MARIKGYRELTRLKEELEYIVEQSEASGDIKTLRKSKSDLKGVLKQLDKIQSEKLDVGV